MIATLADLAGTGTIFNLKGRTAKQDTRKSFDNTLMTIDLLVSFAWSFAVVALAGAALYTWATGLVVTESNLWLGATTALMVTTALIGRQEAPDWATAKRLRNVLSLGITLGVLSLFGSVMLVGMQAVLWVLFA